LNRPAQEVPQQQLLVGIVLTELDETLLQRLDAQCKADYNVQVYCVSSEILVLRHICKRVDLICPVVYYLLEEPFVPEPVFCGLQLFQNFVDGQLTSLCLCECLSLFEVESEFVLVAEFQIPETLDDIVQVETE